MTMTSSPVSAAYSDPVMASNANIFRNVPMRCGWKLARSCLAINLQPVVGENHTRRQLRLRDVVIVIVSEMREIRAGRANAPSGRQRFIEAHVRWVRLLAQGVQDGDFH